MQHKLKTYLLWFLILVYFSGTIGFAMNPEFFKPFTPLTLLLTSFVFLSFQVKQNLTYLSTFLTIGLIGFIIEVIGVKSGLIFGRYTYGAALGFKVEGVPLVISLNWALLISSGVLMGAYFSANKWMNALLSALIITAIDFVIEQVCVQMDFWQFESGLAGMQNYFAWFLISFICSVFFYSVLSKGNKRIALIVLSLQVFFFGVTYIINLL